MRRYIFLHVTLFMLVVNSTMVFCQGQNSTNNTLEKAQDKIISHFQKKSIPFDWNLHSFNKTIKDGKVGVIYGNYFEYEILKPQFAKIGGQSLNWLFSASEQNTDKVRIFNLAGVEIDKYNCRYLKHILNGNCIKDNDTLKWHNSFLNRKDFILSYTCTKYIITDLQYKMGVMDSEGDLLIPIQYDNIVYGGGDFFITYDDPISTKFQIFDINSKKVILNGDEIKVFYSINKEKTYSNHQSLIFDKDEIYALKKSENWQLLNSKLELIYSDTITEIYEVDDHLIVKNNFGYSIITKKGKLISDSIPEYVKNVLIVDDSFLYSTETYSTGSFNYKLYNMRNEVLMKWTNGRLITNKNELKYNYNHIKGKFQERKIIACLIESSDGSVSKIIYENFEIESTEK